MNGEENMDWHTDSLGCSERNGSDEGDDDDSTSSTSL